MSGFVYILSNPSMPGLLKIGSTEKLPTERAAQLYSTGVPEPFKVEFAVWCSDQKTVETDVHEELVGDRVNNSREFFRIGITDAIRRVCWCLPVFTENDINVADSDCVVDDVLIRWLQHCTGVLATAELWLSSMNANETADTIVQRRAKKAVIGE